MNVSVIVPCVNEEKNIGDCLRSLLNMNYRLGEYEIIVVDGNSNDCTRAIVEEFCKRQGKKVTLIIEPKKGVAAGRNAGIKASRYDHIALIDADCEALSNWLTILVDNYQRATNKDHRVVAVGGGNKPPEYSSKFMNAIGVALDSYAGSFNSVQGRCFAEHRYVTSLSSLNVLYRKDKIVEAGCYDESLFSEAEDADLNYRLSLSGHKFVFIPESMVWHKMRPTPTRWLKNMFRYGKGRARLLKRYPAMWKPSFVLPIIFILIMLSTLFSIQNRMFFLPLLYFLAITILSFFMCFKKKKLSVVFYVISVYIVQHFGYALGEMYGLLNPRVK
ncbi:MAG: glycosyltransferase [Pseudomonadota bacterium]